MLTMYTVIAIICMPIFFHMAVIHGTVRGRKLESVDIFTGVYFGVMFALIWPLTLIAFFLNKTVVPHIIAFYESRDNVGPRP